MGEIIFRWQPLPVQLGCHAPNPGNTPSLGLEGRNILRDYEESKHDLAAFLSEHPPRDPKGRPLGPLTIGAHMMSFERRIKAATHAKRQFEKLAKNLGAERALEELVPYSVVLAAQEIRQQAGRPSSPERVQDQADIKARLTAKPVPPPVAVVSNIHEQHYSTEYWRVKWDRGSRQTIIRLAHKETEDAEAEGRDSGIWWSGTVRQTPTISESAAARMYVRHQKQNKATSPKTKKPLR